MTTAVLDAPREHARLAALHEYRLLDSPADDDLAAVVRIATMVADVPTATLNLIDEHRQCQLTTVGFDGADSDRNDSMCAIRLHTGRVVHVPDARHDPVYAANPWVSGALGQVRFYASAPLVTPGGHALGTLCVFDTKPGRLTEEQITRLQDLAQILVALFERRRQARLNAELAAETERRKKLTDTVLETIDVGIVVADPTGHLALFNRAARDWHGVDADPGVDPSELSDRYALFHADGVTSLTHEQVPLLRALRDGSVTGAEMVIKPSGRESVDISASGRRLVGDDGTLIGAVVAMNNVTADRAHRRELERAHTAVAEQSAQLAAAVAELQRSNTELEQFAGAVSHDLVGPLQVVHGYLGLLTSSYGDSLDCRATTWVATASHAVERMQQLIQSLLTYARVGHAACRPQPEDLGQLLDQALMDLHVDIGASGAEIDVPCELPTVVCDPTLIRQLMQNLLGNAVKYRHPDRPSRIRVAVTPDVGHWTVSIIDNGIGVPVDHRRRVFDMCAQVDPSARAGHGIGLATCQRIIDRHGGDISIDETPGGGATVRFTLPYPVTP